MADKDIISVAVGYKEGFAECQKMCIEIIKESSVNGKLDVVDSKNYLVEKIDALLGLGEQ